MSSKLKTINDLKTSINKFSAQHLDVNFPCLINASIGDVLRENKDISGDSVITAEILELIWRKIYSHQQSPYDLLHCQLTGRMDPVEAAINYINDVRRELKN